MVPWIRSIKQYQDRGVNLNPPHTNPNPRANSVHESVLGDDTFGQETLRHKTFGTSAVEFEEMDMHTTSLPNPTLPNPNPGARIHDEVVFCHSVSGALAIDGEMT